MKTPMILLVTDDNDAALTTREAALEMHCAVQRIGSSQEVISTLLDGDHFAFAVIDVDRRAHAKAACHTAAGMMPVVGITSRARTETPKILRDCHAAGCLRKPLQSDIARVAFSRALRRSACAAAASPSSSTEL